MDLQQAPPQRSEETTKDTSLSCTGPEQNASSYETNSQTYSQQFQPKPTPTQQFSGDKGNNGFTSNGAEYTMKPMQQQQLNAFGFPPYFHAPPPQQAQNHPQFFYQQVPHMYPYDSRPVHLRNSNNNNGPFYNMHRTQPNNGTNASEFNLNHDQDSPGSTAAAAAETADTTSTPSSPKPTQTAPETCSTETAILTELTALQTARRIDLEQLELKNLEIAQLRKEIESLRRLQNSDTIASSKEDAFLEPVMNALALSPVRGVVDKDENMNKQTPLLSTSSFVNSLFAAAGGADTAAQQSPQTLGYTNQNGTMTTSSEDAIGATVAAAAEESQSLFNAAPCSPRGLYGIPDSTTSFHVSREYIAEEDDAFKQQSSKFTTVSCNNTKLAPSPAEAWAMKPVSPADTTAPKTVVSVAGNSIWGPFASDVVPEKAPNIPAYLNEAKEFVPSGIFSTVPNDSDPTLSKVRSIWEADEMGLYGAEVYDSIQGEEFTPKSGRPQKGYRPNGTFDRHSSITFHHMVDRIVRTQDQPASLLLQQKLKTPHYETRAEIMDAILHQALNLMRNRFGNFLVQRCLEVGDASQVRAITSTMVGCVVMLSCDRFGCHVVQKALDVCDDEMKALFVNELLQAIPETVTHRFACHVWQRVFETQWTMYPYSAAAVPLLHATYNTNSNNTTAHSTEQQADPDWEAATGELSLSSTTHPVISVVRSMDAVLRGQWHAIANDESGSLVVQCVFENCPEVEKRGIIQEVLAHAADIATGQWGNWVIQHLLDHGFQSDKGHILQIVSLHIHSLSMDQFASKVVEKALKTCPKRELYAIVDRVVSGLRGTPAILEMMNNQYANYVVQHILTLAEPQQRDTCARLIGPHLPLLRGSKYGQRVAAIVEKNIRGGRDAKYASFVPPPQPQPTNTAAAAFAMHQSYLGVRMPVHAQIAEPAASLQNNLYTLQ
ncbi:hypothetical protein CcCBS67573_g03331 [Chytriomyces confervae]|uniref:PUM-HD domain-containing protein n=1 Tax=Chytriomyces confervae TaxID=246404 RepID=A0A507FGM4_9FUNG|nr:hypothetical protein CcCBS67573_g03331 [Chytriomyces confervae]